MSIFHPWTAKQHVLLSRQNSRNGSITSSAILAVDCNQPPEKNHLGGLLKQRCFSVLHPHPYPFLIKQLLVMEFFQVEDSVRKGSVLFFLDFMKLFYIKIK